MNEKVLLREISEYAGLEERAEALWQLAGFYIHEAERRDLAIELLDLMIQESVSRERTALYCATLGQIAQDIENWELAIAYYLKGLAIAPNDVTTVYFLNNNAGYCLNKLGRYSEGERYCRRAIEIDSELHYAYKNLGISLEGQGDLVAAAWAWVDATKANRADPKAFMLLEELVKEHPDLLTRCDWVIEEFTKRSKDARLGYNA